MYEISPNNNILGIMHNYEVNIKTIKERFPKSDLIGIDEDICLVDIKYEDSKGDFGYPCRLDGNVILFCIKGSINISVNLKEYKIQDDELIVCTAGDIINVARPTINESGNWRIVMLTMSHKFASELRLDFKSILNEGILPLESPVIKVNETIRDILSDHMKLIAKVAADKGRLYKDSIHSLISSMVSVLASQWFTEIGNFKTRKKSDSDTRSNHKRFVFEQFMKLVSDNYSEQRQMGFYADKLCLSPKYLSKLIKEVSGKAAPEWIEAYVMLEAKNLLKYSDMPIKEVVYRLNFPNQTAFYKYFKAHTGMTPTDYRNS